MVYAVGERGEDYGYTEMMRRGYSREVIMTDKDDLIDIYFLS